MIFQKFQYVILTKRLFPSFFPPREAKPVGKRGATCGNMTIWQRHTLPSRDVLAHSWIFFCRSGTYRYVITRVECGHAILVCHGAVCISRSVPFLSLSFFVTKAILWQCLFLLPAVSVSGSTPSQAGTARLLPFWSRSKCPGPVLSCKAWLSLLTRPPNTEESVF